MPESKRAEAPVRSGLRGRRFALLYRRLGYGLRGRPAYCGYVKTRNLAGGSNKKPDPTSPRVGLCQPPRKATSPPKPSGSDALVQPSIGLGFPIRNLPSSPEIISYDDPTRPIRTRPVVVRAAALYRRCFGDCGIFFSPQGRRANQSAPG